MKPPRPILVAVILILLAVMNLTRLKGTGAEAAGFIFATLFFPAFLGLAYTWWYRRRTPPPGG